SRSACSLSFAWMLLTLFFTAISSCQIVGCAFVTSMRNCLAYSAFRCALPFGPQRQRRRPVRTSHCSSFLSFPARRLFHAIEVAFESVDVGGPKAAEGS